MIERTTFFGAVRHSLFGGRFRQSQVEGINAILDEWENTDELTDERWLAYILATAYYETCSNMQPWKEQGGDGYFFRLYDIGGGRPTVASYLGNLDPGDGVRFIGRGLVPLLGRRNYARMSAVVTHPRFDIELEKDPDAALRLDIAVAILFEGMMDPCTNLVGGFAGYALDQFFNETRDDPVGARQIIYGRDEADVVAGCHRQFLSAIRAALQMAAA